MAVVQFGLAIMSLCHLMSEALISGMTRGTFSSIRKALELSMTTHPAWAAMGANSFEMLPPALNSAMSMPAKESFFSSVTAMSWPRYLSVLPSDRVDASNVSFPTGKLRFSSVLIISRPTAPVAPTTATCGLRFILMGQNIDSTRRMCQRADGTRFSCFPEFQILHYPPGIRILSGIQPSGTLHLGNYFGMMKPALELQEKGQAFYFIANYHSMTTLVDPAERRQNTLDVALDFLACGLDPKKTVFFRQSDVPEVTELTWILGTVTPMGLLERCHSYKDKIAKGIAFNFGLFAYPVLMASDILIYDSNVVPVGLDQKQHVEVRS